MTPSPEVGTFGFGLTAPSHNQTATSAGSSEQEPGAFFVGLDLTCHSQVSSCRLSTSTSTGAPWPLLAPLLSWSEFPVFPFLCWTPHMNCSIRKEFLECTRQSACMSEDAALWAPAKDINAIDMLRYRHAASVRTHANRNNFGHSSESSAHVDSTAAVTRTKRAKQGLPRWQRMAAMAARPSSSAPGACPAEVSISRHRGTGFHQRVLRCHVLLPRRPRIQFHLMTRPPPPSGVEIAVAHTQPRLVPRPSPTHSRWRICSDRDRTRPSPEPPVLPKCR